MTNTTSNRPPRPQKISDLIQMLLDHASHEDRISIGSILEIFGVRGFAFLLLVLALLNIVIFMVPMVSMVFGLPMVILAGQMVWGMKTPKFPHFLRSRTIPRTALVVGLNKAIHGIGKFERYVIPRFTFISVPMFTRVHGLVALLLALMVALPIPLFNVPPSIALVLLAIGILQRDGIFIVLGYFSAMGCLVLFKSLGHILHTLLHSF